MRIEQMTKTDAVRVHPRTGEVVAVLDAQPTAKCRCVTRGHPDDVEPRLVWSIVTITERQEVEVPADLGDSPSGMPATTTTITQLVRKLWPALRCRRCGDVLAVDAPGEDIEL